MTQPAGRVLGVHSKYSFYLNSSPIVCVGNALGIVSKLCWRIYNLKSVDAATSLTAKEHFHDVESPEQPSGLAQLQETKAVRLLVFFLGALPQVIKLYAMGGITVTKVCASMYLGSFLIIEAAMRWLEKYQTDSRGQDDRAKNGCGNANATRIFILFFSQYAAVLIKHRFCSTLGCIFWCLSFIISVNFVIIFMSATFREWPEHYSSSPSELEQWLTFFLLPCFCVALLFGIAVWFGLFQWNFGIGTLLGILYGTAAVILMGFIYIGTEVDVMLKRWGESNLRKCGGHPLLFMLFHLLAGLQYYFYDYDSKGTYKPAWTNQLG